MPSAVRRTVLVPVALLVAASALAGDPPKTGTAAAPGKPPAAGKAESGDGRVPVAPKPATDAAPKPVIAASRVPTPRSIEDALRTLGRRRCDVDFREIPLTDVVAFIAQVSGLNVIVSGEFQREAAGALSPVTLRLKDVSLRQVAELVAKTTGSELILRDGVVQFTTPKDARGAPILRIFAIAELTFRVRNFPGPDIQLHTGDSKFVQEEESDQPGAFDDPQVVVDLVKRFTGKGTWEDEDVSIVADDRKLVVRQYPKVMKEISVFLALLRAAK